MSVPRTATAEPAMPSLVILSPAHMAKIRTQGSVRMQLNPAGWG
jgi:hypothetical protein